MIIIKKCLNKNCRLFEFHIDCPDGNRQMQKCPECDTELAIVSMPSKFNLAYQPITVSEDRQRVRAVKYNERSIKCG